MFIWTLTINVTALAFVSVYPTAAPLEIHSANEYKAVLANFTCNTTEVSLSLYRVGMKEVAVDVQAL